MTPSLRLVQFLDEDGNRRVAKVDASGSQLQVLADTTRIYDLALEAGLEDIFPESTTRISMQ